MKNTTIAHVLFISVIFNIYIRKPEGNLQKKSYYLLISENYCSIS